MEKFTIFAARRFGSRCALCFIFMFDQQPVEGYFRKIIESIDSFKWNSGAQGMFLRLNFELLIPSADLRGLLARTASTKPDATLLERSFDKLNDKNLLNCYAYAHFKHASRGL